VAGDHNTHFARVSKILELMDLSDIASKLQHVNFNETSHMSDKLRHEHNTLGATLDRYNSATDDSLKENPEKVTLLGDSKELISAVGAVALLTQELSARRTNDNPFDLTRTTSFDPQTGLDLYYWDAKLSGILKTNPTPSDLSCEVCTSWTNVEEIALLRLLVQYPEVTQGAYKTLEPATIVAYLVNVAGQLESCFEDEDEGADPSPVQAVLWETARIVLENGMKILGIKPSTA